MMPLRASENIVHLAVEFHHGSLLGLGGALRGRVHGKYDTPLPGVTPTPLSGTSQPEDTGANWVLVCNCRPWSLHFCLCLCF